MANEKNMALSDEEMAKATGGVIEPGEPKFDIGDKVHLHFKNEEGVVTMVAGTVIERKSSPAMWTYKISYEVNGTLYEHWYPEMAIDN